MNAPCKECLCVPICRHKRYKALLDECSIVYGYVFFIEGKYNYYNERYWDRKELIRQALQPKWETNRGIPP